jgi:hypothetical protein
MDNVRFAHIRCLPESGLEFLLEQRQFELAADSGGLVAYANCYDLETRQGPSFGGFLLTDKSLIVYPQAVRTNASYETRAMG